VEVEVSQFLIKFHNFAWSLNWYILPILVLQEVCANLLNGKSKIAPILKREGGKDEV